MLLTEVVAVWDLFPDSIDEEYCSDSDLEGTFSFEDFVNAVHKVVGVEIDIEALGG